MHNKKIKYFQCVVCNTATNFTKKCNICNRVALRLKERRRQIKRLPIQKYKINLKRKLLIDYKGGCCSSCGYNKSTRALCFHHIDENTKSFSVDVRSIMRKSFIDCIIEVNKCNILCVNCHSILHAQERKLSRTNKNLIKQYNNYIELKMHYINISPSCKSCNMNFTKDNISAAHFHHNYNREFSINCFELLKRSKDEIDKEFIKCTLYCGNCHMEIEEKLSNKP